MKILRFLRKTKQPTLRMLLIERLNSIKTQVGAIQSQRLDSIRFELFTDEELLNSIEHWSRFRGMQDAAHLVREKEHD